MTSNTIFSCLLLYNVIEIHFHLLNAVELFVFHSILVDPAEIYSNDGELTKKSLFSQQPSSLQTLATHILLRENMPSIVEAAW